jgi:hypothetical protein
MPHACGSKRQKRFHVPIPEKDSRGALPPAKTPDFWNNKFPATVVALGDVFGDDRHWIGDQSRRCRSPGPCFGCMSAFDVTWYAYVAALVTYLDGEWIIEKPVAWNIPFGNVDDLGTDIRGVTFDVKKAHVGDPKILKITRRDVPIRTDIPPAWDMNVYFDIREKRSKPIQIHARMDETSAEATRRYLDAEKAYADGMRGQPSLPGFGFPVWSPSPPTPKLIPATVVDPKSPEEVAKTRAKMDEARRLGLLGDGGQK